MTYSDFLALVDALSRDVRVEPNTPVEIETRVEGPFHVYDGDNPVEVDGALASAHVADHPRRIVLSDR